MKKFFLASVFASASVLVVAGLSLAITPAAFAQASNGQISINDPAEYNAYQNAITQTTPQAKASASEAFLKQFPQSKVKLTILSGLVEAYAAFDAGKAVDAAQRLLQLDSTNLEAMYLIAAIDKQQAQSNPAQQAQLLDDAAADATKGLAATKPTDTKDDVWTKQKAAADQVFYSVLSADALYSKKDLPAAITAFRTELEYLAKNNPDATKAGPGLNDTLLLGQTYTQLTPPDMVNGVWFLSRASNFAPANFKPQIDKSARYWYKRFHGKEDGYEAVLALSATTIFPPPDFKIAPAPTPKDIADKAFTDSASDLAGLAMGDKEYILANASKDNADKLWAVVKDQVTQVPGTVIAATASQIQVAVTEDAKADKKADFTVNMKTPLADKDVPAVGSEISNLIGTYDSYTQTPPQIILRDGEIQVAKKAPVHKPSPAHKKAS